MVKGSSLSTRVISIQCSLLILIKFEISEKKEMSNLSLSQWYSLLYEKRLKDVKLDIDMTLDVLRRRKNFESPVTTKDNTHDGESLMRKAAEFKRYIERSSTSYSLMPECHELSNHSMLNWHLECGTAGSYSVFRLRVSIDLVVVETRNIHHRYSVVDIPTRALDGISSDIPSRDTEYFS